MDLMDMLAKYADKYGVGPVFATFVIIVIFALIHVWLGYTRTLNFWIAVFIIVEAMVVETGPVEFYLIGMAYSYLEEGDVVKFVIIMAFVSVSIFLNVAIKALKKKYRLE